MVTDRGRFAASRRVAVLGMAVVAPIGIGVDAFRARAFAPRVVLSKARGFGGTDAALGLRSVEG